MKQAIMMAFYQLVFILLFAGIASANVSPSANFVSTSETNLGVLKINYDGSTSADSDGTIVSYSWNFGDGATGTGTTISHTYSMPATYNVSLTVTDNLGATNTFSKTVIVKDQVGPVVTFWNTQNSSTYYTGGFPTTIQIKITFNEPIYWVKYQGEVRYPFIDINNTATWDVEITAPGTYAFAIQPMDLGWNYSAATFVYHVVEDTLVPQSEFVSYPKITNQSTAPVTISVRDIGTTTTYVKVNNVLATTSHSKYFTYSYPLPLEGLNRISVQSFDWSGWGHDEFSVWINKDTVAPVLSNLAPANSSSVDKVAIQVSGNSNEKLADASVNGVSLNISSDGLSFSGQYVVPSNGVQNLEWIAHDLAGNEVNTTTTIDVVSRLLIPELVSIRPNANRTQLEIIGAPGATRGNTELKASTGLLSWNTARGISNHDGSFVLALDPFTSVRLTAEDPLTHQAEFTDMTYTRATTLSGIVKDSNSTPIPGVTVSIIGSASSAVTDSSGVFVIPTPTTGDQMLLIDGTTVPSSVTGTTKKYSKSKVSISIGLGTVNALPRPLYLTPLITDGSETPISPTTVTVITSTHAPGVKLTVPGGAATFPAGIPSGSINMATIPSGRSITPVPGAAVPTNVIALEPSGVSFSERAELQLPNDNELPAGVELVILSMNSEKGIWEVDGFAKVDPSGSSITTKPGQGISHFSLVYAVPLMPKVIEAKSSKFDAVNIAENAFSTSFSLPSFSFSGQDLAPKLIYNTSWANPTALVSNVIDIPEQKTEVIEDVQLPGQRQRFRFKETTCFLGICDSEWKSTLVRIENKAHVERSSWYVPDNIKAQFFVGGVASDEVDYVNVPSSSSGDLPGGSPSGGAKSSVAHYSGIPNRSLITFGVPLKKANNQYLETGVYPTVARYQIRLKNMVITTVSGESTIFDENGGVSKEYIPAETTEESIQLQQIFPQDIRSSVAVQNKIKSYAGRGWHLGGMQKIINPANDNLVIEESDGSLSSYSIENSISTVVDATSTELDLKSGVSLKQWPQIYGVGHDSTNESYIAKVDLSSSGPQVVQRVASLPTGRGTAANLGWANCGPTYSGSFSTSKIDYKVIGKVGSIVVKDDGTIYGVNSFEDGLFRIDSVGYQSLSHQGLHSVAINTADLSAFSSEVFYASGWNRNPAPVSVNTYPCSTALPSNPIRNNLILPSGGYLAGNDLWREVDTEGQPAGNMYTNPSALGLAHPQDIIVDSQGYLVVADLGNQTVKRFNISDGSAKRIAGTGSYGPPPINGNALSTPLSNPTGLAIDSLGTIYVSLRTGYVVSIQPDSTAKVIAGRALSDGGVIADESPALTMNLAAPHGLVVDNQKRVLYVADKGHNRILSIDLATGIAKKVAGTGTCSGSEGEGGVANLASICAPTQIGLDHHGNVLFVDSERNKVKKVVFKTSSGGSLSFAPSKKDFSRLLRLSDGTWERRFRDGSKVLFSAQGHQTKAITRAGLEVSYTYSGDKLLNIKDFYNRTISYNYSGDKLISIVDPSGRSTLFNYNGDFLSQVTFPSGATKKFFYSNTGMMSEEVNEENKVTAYRYNNWNRLNAIENPDGTRVQMWDAASQSVNNNSTEMNPAQLAGTGLTNDSFYDSFYDPNGNLTRLQQSSFGTVSKVMNPKGEVTQYEIDDLGRVTTIVNPDQSIVSNTYSSNFGDLVAVTDVDANLTRSRTLNDYGQVLTVTNGLGKTKELFYDPVTGNLISETSADGAIQSFTYNSLGEVTSKTETKGVESLTWLYEYNSFGKVAKETLPNGNYISYLYDSAGNRTHEISFTTGASTVTKAMEYDLANNLVKVTNPKGDITIYGYNLQNKISTVTDAKGRVTQYSYDEMGRVAARIEPDGNTYTYTYDGNGNLSTEVFPAGNYKAYSYDSLNRVTKITYPDDTLRYVYDWRGRVTQLKNNLTQINYTLNTRGLPTAEQLTEVYASGYPSVILNHTYDGANNRIGLATSYGNYAFTYNDDDQLIGIENGWGDSLVYTRDFQGKIKSLQRPGSTTEYVYNTDGTAQSIVTKSGSSTKASVSYQYDLRRLATSRVTSGGTTTYGYDANMQLINESTSGGFSDNYSYDSLGNRTTSSSGGLDYSVNQQLVADSKFTYVYDKNGNLTSKISKDTSKPSFYFDYNSKNQLRRMQKLDSAFNTLMDVNFVYDPLGRRIKKTVHSPSASSDPKKTYTRYYVYDGENILFEFNGSGSVLSKYTHSNVAVDDVVAAHYTPAGVTAGLATTSGTAYFLKDATGSITDVINGSGNIVQSYGYAAFGSILSIKNSSGADISNDPTIKTYYSFAGREWDDELGMYYNRARYYDSSIGRFIQKDPYPGDLINPQTHVNSYIYGNNSPLAFTDPTGELAWFIAIPLASAIGGAVFSAVWAGINGQDILAAAGNGAISGLVVGLGAVAGIAISGAAIGTLGAAIGGSIGGGIGGGLMGYLENPGNPLLGLFVGAVFGAIGGGMAGGINLTGPGSTTADAVSGTIINSPPLEIPRPRPMIPAPRPSPPPPNMGGGGPRLGLP
jgi:RHS repeat-associated protein